MLLLFWDVDGTLLMTARAGILAWEDATAALVGHPVDLSQLETAGLTDVEIARNLVLRFGLDPTPRCLDGLLRGYESRLPTRLGQRAGRVLPGVRAILDYLRGCPGVRSLLLTGNTEAGARAKLRHYGLGGYFAEGAFADGAPDRLAIARRALARGRELVGGDLVLEHTFVIGDTPADVSCAREIGARAVAVATGPYSVAQLRRHDPWWVIERLPGPEVFLGRLRGAARCGRSQTTARGD